MAQEHNGTLISFSNSGGRSCLSIFQLSTPPHLLISARHIDLNESGDHLTALNLDNAVSPLEINVGSTGILVLSDTQSVVTNDQST